jgi:hypothetical protein
MKWKLLILGMQIASILAFINTPLLARGDRDRDIGRDGHDRDIDLYDRNRLNLDFSPYDYPDDRSSDGRQEDNYYYPNNTNSGRDYRSNYYYPR